MREESTALFVVSFCLFSILPTSVRLGRATVASPRIATRGLELESLGAIGHANVEVSLPIKTIASLPVADERVRTEDRAGFRIHAGDVATTESS